MTAPFFTQWGLLTILEFKHFEGPLKLNSKTFKHQIRFKEKHFTRTFKDFQEERPPWLKQ